MQEIIDKIVLKDKIEFQGSIEKLKMKLNESKGRNYNVEWISYSEFKFLSKWSIGTLIVKGMPGLVDGIKGYGKIHDKGNCLIVIDLTTKVRVEMYSITGIFAFFFLALIFMKESFPIWIYLLLPISLIWFWFVFRLQENALFKKVKEHLNR